jgi:hypothetical protein
MRKQKNVLFMKKLKTALFGVCALCLAALPFGVNGLDAVRGKADRTLQESNSSYVMSAVSDENSVGVAVTYVKANGNAQMEFDLLKNVENGYFGVLFGQEASLSKLSCDYVAFSANGSAFLSQGLPAASFAFKSGYRYRVEFDKKSSTARILRKPYAAYETLSFETVYTAKISSEVGTIGVFTRSQGENSASVYMDNFYAALADGTTVQESFDKRVGNIQTAYSNVSSYGQLSAGARYTVVFTDVSGNALKVVDTSEYGYATCEAPMVEGKTFVGWNINPKCVTADMILYPIYKDGAESGGNSGGNPNDTPVTDSGCGGTVSGLGCAVLVSAAAVVAVIKKKGE